MQIFEERGRWCTPGKISQSREEEKTNELNPPMTPSLEIDPGQHWWEVSAFTTTPPLLSKWLTYYYNKGVVGKIKMSISGTINSIPYLQYLLEWTISWVDLFSEFLSNFIASWGWQLKAFLCRTFSLIGYLPVIT